MDEAKEKSKKICELKDKLVCGLQEQFGKGLMQVNTEEAGQVTDMIKDLAEADEKIWKACYYKKIVEAMKEEKEQEELMMKMGMGEEDGGRRGYDNWRYSSGRFAPTGRGHFAGYTPMADMEEMEPWMNDSMGYSGGSGRSGGGQNGSRSGGSGRSVGSSSSGSGSSNTGYGGESRMGYPGSERGHRYDTYSQARMGYHESRDAKSKEHMDASAKEYVMDISEAMKEIWKDADPAMRKEIKGKFTALMSEMN